MRRVLGLILMLGVATPAAAQRDAASFGEGMAVTVTRPGHTAVTPFAPVAPVVGSPSAEATPALAKLRAQIAGAIGFLIRWGGGASSAPAVPVDPATPVLVGAHRGTVRDTRLALPFAGLGLERDRAGAVRAVTVQTMTVVPAGRPPVTGAGRLMLDGTRVTTVEITPAP